MTEILIAVMVGICLVWVIAMIRIIMKMERLLDDFKEANERGCQKHQK